MIRQFGKGCAAKRRLRVRPAAVSEQGGDHTVPDAGRGAAEDPVEMELQDAVPGRSAAGRDGVTVAETVTDQYGFYRITDLYPAVYTLRVTAPAEVKPTRKRTDIRIIASSLEETDGDVCYTGEITVESDRANYNVDLGFVTRRYGVLPAGYGQGKTQNWQK